MAITTARREVDVTSRSSFSKLRGLRDKIARKEAEMDGAVSQARRKSDGRVGRTTGVLHAENELEETLLELTNMKAKRRASAERFSSARPSLQREVDQKRLDLVAASPPYILKLEQAMTTVAIAHQRENKEPLKMQTRWRSSLVALMKDVVDGICQRVQLPGNENTNKAANKELALAATSARLLSLHVNAWTMPQLSRELERIWLQAVDSEAKNDPEFRYPVAAWKLACATLDSCVSTAHEEACIEQPKWDAAIRRAHDCRARMHVRPNAEKAGWWQEREGTFLSEELRHIERKIAPLASPSHLAAMYNMLLAKCAAVGAWATAVASYRSMDARISGGGSRSNGSSSLNPVVYRQLLRAAKNARPPQPRAAMLVLREMRLRGVEPSVAHYNIVVSACARAVGAADFPSLLIPLEYAEEDSFECENVRQHRCVEGPDASPIPGGGVTCSFRGLKKGKRGMVGDAESATEGPLSRTDGDQAQGDTSAWLTQTGLARCAGDDARRTLLFDRNTALERWTPEAMGNAWRLALQVVADMRERGIVPTEVTYRTLVECCRCAGKGSSVAASELYAALKRAKIPMRFCYEASVENALNGGRRFPEYVNEISRF